MHSKEKLAILLAIEKSDFDTSLGAEAYNAFAAFKGWVSFKGDKLSSFAAMEAKFQQAWIAFAYAISLDEPIAVAWDQYYKTVCEEINYAGQPHQWTYAKLQAEKSPTIAALDAAAAKIIKSTPDAKSGKKTKFKL